MSDKAETPKAHKLRNITEGLIVSELTIPGGNPLKKYTDQHGHNANASGYVSSGLQSEAEKIVGGMKGDIDFRPKGNAAVISQHIAANVAAFDLNKDGNVSPNEIGAYLAASRIGGRPTQFEGYLTNADKDAFLKTDPKIIAAAQGLLSNNVQTGAGALAAPVMWGTVVATSVPQR